MTKSESIAELAQALNKFQMEVEGAKRINKNPFYNSKYADLATIWETVREPLTSNGLSVVQTFETNTETIATEEVNTKSGVITKEIKFLVNITTTLLHLSGEFISGVLTLPLTKSDPQQAGSAITYGRRYALAAILGIHQEDDDANAHARKPEVDKKADTLETSKAKCTEAIKQFFPDGKIPDEYVKRIAKAGEKTVLDGLFLELKKEKEEIAAKIDERNAQIDREAAETAQILPDLAAKPENGDNTQADAQIGLDAVKTTLLLQINNCVLKGYNGYSDKENLKKDLKEKLGVEGTSLNDAVAKCKDIDFINNYIEFLNTKIQSDSPFTYGDTSNPVSNDLTDKQQKAIRLLDNLAELTIDGYQTQKHRSASIKDHLGTVTVNACKDIAKLDDYIIHLEKQVTK
jgi:hypothetical protein